MARQLTFGKLRHLLEFVNICRDALLFFLRPGLYNRLWRNLVRSKRGRQGLVWFTVSKLSHRWTEMWFD